MNEDDHMMDITGIRLKLVQYLSVFICLAALGVVNFLQQQAVRVLSSVNSVSPPIPNSKFFIPILLFSCPTTTLHFVPIPQSLLPFFLNFLYEKQHIHLLFSKEFNTMARVLVSHVIMGAEFLLVQVFVYLSFRIDLTKLKTDLTKASLIKLLIVISVELYYHNKLKKLINTETYDLYI